MKNISRTTLTIALMVACNPAGAADTASPAFESTYYKDWPMFSTYAKETERTQPIEHFGPVGIGIELLLPPFQMKLSRIDKGSPAEASGKLKVGQMIESINGQTLKDIDPRIILGGIITKAEATDGVIRFMVKDTPDAKAEEVVVNIPVLGTYSKTWPLNCPKSDKIVRNQADFLARSGNYAGNGISGLGLLYLLSTGEEKDLEVARGWIKEVVEKHKNTTQLETSPWYAGYGGIGLCEYYLRTGDASILPVIEMNADYLRRNMYNGGWNQRGGVNFSYGHLNAAGVPSTTFLLLARECGAKIDEYTLQESLKHFYRFAGHGNVAYGDALPETGFVDNGKTGKLAFQMAAAATLTPEGENSVYAKARDICASKSFYSTSWMLHGHTGGGVGEIWRSGAMGLMHDKKPLQYREFMDNRQWFYELSRRFDGSMGIVGGTIGNGQRYDNPQSWGIGLALSYTIPRKTLRITGAPATKFSKPYQLPKRPWGTEADEAFYSLTSTAGPDGKVPDWSNEKLATDAGGPITRHLDAPDVADEVLLTYARHPDHGIRQIAANAIGRKPGDSMILQLLRDKDPRMRNAGCMAISTRTAPKARDEPPQAALLTDEMVELLIGMVNDPNESWWVVEGALTNLGLAKPDLLAPRVDRLCHWLQHEDWWLRRAALTALGGLVADERFYQKLLPIIGRMAAENRSNVTAFKLAEIGNKLSNASPAVQALAAKSFAQGYAELPAKLQAPGGLDLANAEQFLAQTLAGTLASQPGGLDVLYALANKRYPDQSLPHKELFFNADPAKLGPALKKEVQSVIRDQLIPEYVAGSLPALMGEVGGNPVVADPKQQAKVEELVALYDKMEVNEYDWQPFGPAWDSMRWDYFSFDPPETMPWDPGVTRYRKVTYPAGMENWFATDFDAKKAGWQNGLQPFGQENGKLRTEPKPYYDQLHGRSPSQQHPCTFTYCRCCEPMKTFWDKEVLLIRGTFEIPPLKEGHRYRLTVGGLSHMNNGDGVRVYVNGKQVLEREREFKKREGGHPIVYYIDPSRLAEFQSGKVTIAATGFMHIHFRSKNKANFMGLWFEEMKMPTVDDALVKKALKAKSLVSAEWQDLQDPGRNSEDPEAGKYQWDGKWAANPALLGSWTTIGQVPSIEAFNPAKPVDAGRAPIKIITFLNDGKTSDATRFWTSNTLIDMEKLQALKMTTKDDFLFLEAGGFSERNPVGWKSPLIVMKRVP
jgi:hypothetical protein